MFSTALADYLPYLQTFWAYFPYIFCTYVFLTLLPKSYCRIKVHADADYAANRGKYHRCYAPDVCCHTLDGAALPKQKPRKAVTRVYPKRNNSVEQNTHTAAPLRQQSPQESNHIKRQVPASSIQTNTHVNQIAKMFENGNALTVTVAPVLLGKKINRVTPTILCQDAAERETYEQQRQSSRAMTPPEEQHLHENLESSLRLLSSRAMTPPEEQHLHENLESSLRLLQQTQVNGDASDPHWRDDNTPPRRTRAVPPTLSYAGTSTTPSTASPAASSPLSTSPQSTSPLSSPVLLRAPLNMKSSLEDIFAAIARQAEQNENFIYTGCKSLSPVTSIDDILAQRRLSRPLSAYSISDLLNEESAGMDETCVENFLCALNKT